jgi:TPP-dependent pyruvate/acetoin dehydrogenase alpha subunit
MTDKALPTTARVLEMHRMMCTIREFDEQAGQALDSGLARGSVHQYVGEEAIATGVCANLAATDYIASYHRGHGHSIAKGVDPVGMAKELLGRTGGVCGGKGGSMHIADFSRGMLGANGVVPDGVSLAVGAAQAVKLLRQDRIVAAFFGDGALNRGPFFEALNWARVYQLPLLFICEDNLYSATQRTGAVTAGPGGVARAQSFDIVTETVDGNDVLAVDAAAARLTARIRDGGGPAYLYATTYRWYGHLAFDKGLYRDPAEVKSWRERDCIARIEAWLIGRGVDKAALAATREAVKRAIDAAYEAARAAPFPDKHHAFTDVQDIGGPAWA